MKIKFHPLKGEAKAAKLPYAECSHVIVKGACPVCAKACVLIAHDIKETVIFLEKDRKQAEQHLRDRGAESWEELVPFAEGEWKIMGIDAQHSCHWARLLGGSFCIWCGGDLKKVKEID